MNKRNILITGHQGFIGSYLWTALSDNPDNKLLGIDLKSGQDILRAVSFSDRIDIVIHLAAEPGVVRSVEDPETNARTNILGTIHLLKLLPDAKFIFASSGGTIQETIESPYGLSKYCCEEYIKLLSNNYVILRFPNVYGVGSRSVVDKFLQEDQPVIYGDGTANRTYGHVSDVVEAIIASMEWPQGTYKLGSSQNYTVKEIAEAIGKPYTHQPKRQGELDHSTLHNETLGWEPRIELMDYIREMTR